MPVVGPVAARHAARGRSRAIPQRVRRADGASRQRERTRCNSDPRNRAGSRRRGRVRRKRHRITARDPLGPRTHNARRGTTRLRAELRRAPRRPIARLRPPSWARSRRGSRPRTGCWRTPRQAPTSRSLRSRVSVNVGISVLSPRPTMAYAAAENSRPLKRRNGAALGAASAEMRDVADR